MEMLITLDDDLDLDPDLVSRRPEDEGVGVVGRWSEASEADGETPSENAAAGEESTAEEEERSRVLGT